MHTHIMYTCIPTKKKNRHRQTWTHTHYSYSIHRVILYFWLTSLHTCLLWILYQWYLRCILLFKSPQTPSFQKLCKRMNKAPISIKCLKIIFVSENSFTRIWMFSPFSSKDFFFILKLLKLIANSSVYSLQLIKKYLTN